MQSGPPKLEKKIYLPYLDSDVEYHKNNPPTIKLNIMCISTMIINKSLGNRF